MAPTVPQPRTPAERSDPVRQWYENELGWATAPGPGPVRLLTGLRFDVLELPAEAGRAALRHLGPKAPVALRGATMRILVGAGSADELPGLLDWLEWGRIPLGLTAVGAGGRMDAPTPPGWSGSRGAAIWLRPPEPGCEVEPTLPALPSLPGVGEGGTAPHSDPAVGSGLVRLVDTAATECHRVRLRRRSRQPLAFS
ncbi:SCO3374 family protein [Streptomyces sp. NPDC047123]|uniref:SCO3374 family protein n=1 Tax=Streptomyces sp. NPDC047123 TaxID=3155622 RepID=UPI00340754F8